MKELQELNWKSDLERIFNPGEAKFKVVDSDKLREIAAGMPEIHRAMSAFCKTNSQATSSLMTLTMMTCGPYRVLRQILAELKRKTSALRETYYGMREKEVRVKKLRKLAESKEDPLDRELLLIRAEAFEGQLMDAKDSVEAALKEVGMYQEAYRQIRDANGIRENWDESDFEAAEVAHHVRSAFRLAVRDVMATGRLGMGTLEYLEQFGINPAQADIEVSQYFEKLKGIQRRGEDIDVEYFHSFLDAMAEKFADAWKKAAARVGLKGITFDRWLYTEDK